MVFDLEGGGHSLGEGGYEMGSDGGTSCGKAQDLACPCLGCPVLPPCGCRTRTWQQSVGQETGQVGRACLHRPREAFCLYVESMARLVKGVREGDLIIYLHYDYPDFKGTDGWGEVRGTPAALSFVSDALGREYL